MPEQFKHYLEIVGQQIRWKRARLVLLEELEDHASEQLEACLEEGLSQEEAVQETLRQLGDPVEIGQQLDQVHRPKPQWGLLLLVSLLSLAGMALQLVLLADANRGPAPERLLLWAVLGLGALVAGYFINYAKLIRWGDWVFLGAAALTMALLVLSPIRNNAPYLARYMTFLYPVVFGLSLCCRRGKGWWGLLCSLTVLVMLLALAMMVPSMKDGLILLLSAGVLLLAAVWKDWFGIGRKKGLAVYGVGLLCGVVLLFLLVTQGAYAVRRLEMALHPEADPMGAGYMGTIIHSLLAGAQTWGTGEVTGYLVGRNYWQVVPESTRDAFLVTVIHFLGWAPFLLLLGGLALLLLWAAVKSFRQKNSTAQLLTQSILLLFLGNTALGLLLTLGFVVAGSHCSFLQMSFETVLNLGLMGLLLSVFRQETLPYTAVQEPHLDPEDQPHTPREWLHFLLDPNLDEE